MAKLTDKLNQFIQNVQGQFIEVSDRSNIYQCYDLAALWVMILGFPKSTISHLYAYEIYTKPNANTRDFFDLIPNSPSFVPEDGDIAVFDKTSGNIAGHVGIALGGGNVNSFILFNQNNPLGTNAHMGTYDYNNPKLLGVLRPKYNLVVPPTGGPTINDQTRIPGNLLTSDNFKPGSDMEVQAIRSTLNDQAGQLKGFNDYKNRFNQETQNHAVEAAVNNLNSKIDNAQKP